MGSGGEFPHLADGVHRLPGPCVRPQLPEQLQLPVVRGSGGGVPSRRGRFLVRLSPGGECRDGGPAGVPGRRCPRRRPLFRLPRCPDGAGPTPHARGRRTGWTPRRGAQSLLLDAGVRRRPGDRGTHPPRQRGPRDGGGRDRRGVQGPLDGGLLPSDGNHRSPLIAVARLPPDVIGGVTPDIGGDVLAQADDAHPPRDVGGGGGEGARGRAALSPVSAVRWRGSLPELRLLPGAQGAQPVQAETGRTTC